MTVFAISVPKIVCVTIWLVVIVINIDKKNWRMQSLLGVASAVLLGLTTAHAYVYGPESSTQPTWLNILGIVCILAATAFFVFWFWPHPRSSEKAQSSS